MDGLAFHPLVARWFAQRFGEPTLPQRQGWPHIAAGRDTLIAAPTGSGKTLAAFLWALNRLIARAAAPQPQGGLFPQAVPLPDATSVVYVSPLKALGNDIQRNLQQPLAELQRLAAGSDAPLPEIRVLVRSGDTPAHERQAMVRRPPHILITTPESLYILLTAERSRRMLATAETVIVDEIHAVAGDKRGAHLALSLERLDHLAGRRLQRVGLSATQKPIEEVARLLVGSGRGGDPPDCAIVDVGHQRALDLRVEVTAHELGPIATHELYADIYDRIAAHAQSHRSTIVFVNTRRLVERVAHQLAERLGKDKVAAHHGSLSRPLRLQAEEGLKSGAIPVVVATASLELGIDVGHVDLVCHLGAPRAIATLLQRVGRSGHWLGAVPKGILFPLTRDDLVQCAAAVRAVYAGALDRLHIPESPLDVLAQQMVATVASGEIGEEELWELIRRAHSFRNLPRADFEAVLEMLAEGVATRRGRRSAHLHRDRVHGRLRPRRGARLAAVTSGGAIPDTADYDVVEDPAAIFVGKVNEDFAVESMAGDIFLLGNHSWRIRRVETGRIRVEDAHGAPPTIPFWLGEAPARTAELSAAVAALRADVAQRLAGRPTESGAHPSVGEPGNEGTKVPEPAKHLPLPSPASHAGEGADEGSAACAHETAKQGTHSDPSPSSSPRGNAGRGDQPFGAGTECAADRASGAVRWLQAECHIEPAAAEQVVAYIAATAAVLGTVPTQQTVIAERFFDEGGGMQLVMHAPFGGRINRAWGLALRKRFCRTFDFELQAAATDDGIVLSLGEQHSFPLESVFAMLRSTALEADLVQAALAAPMFGTRWRWNATRALALLRHTGGRRVPMPIQRMRAEDLLAAVFPAQVACGDNHPGGPVEIPNHPLVKETIDNCLREAMDVDGLRAVLGGIERGELRTLAVDTAAPSPMSHEILNANPYAFLDDAPLEERRARAVALRRVDPDLAEGVGALDPAAIAEVRAQAWPDVRDADELHDLLLSVIVLPRRGEAFPRLVAESTPIAQEQRARDDLPEQAEMPRPFSDALIAAGRATVAQLAGRSFLVARERLPFVQAVFTEACCAPSLAPLPGSAAPEREEAAHAIVQGWVECLGPVTAEQLAVLLGLSDAAIEAALLRLESEGVVLRGRFTQSVESPQTRVDRGSAAVHSAAYDSRLSALNSRLAPEWCERRLLARIHRLTVSKLRKEVEAVSAADFLRFLLRWQHVSPQTQLHGRDGVLQIIAQLQGMELPAPAWERDVLAARIQLYNPADLEYLCLAGEVAWARLRCSPPAAEDEATPVRGRRRVAPTRAVPLAFVLRQALPGLLEPAAIDTAVLGELSAAARDVFTHLRAHGAVFLSDLARATGRLPTETEDALWELVARGLVTGDGIAGLRTLLLPEVKRRARPRRLHGLRGGAGRRLMPVGRWAVLRAGAPAETPAGGESEAEFWARQLLRRYGIVLRELLAREGRAPAWRALLGVYRRMEARGEIRGGRFVAGFVGEQFALPEAVDTVRAMRRTAADDGVVTVAAADPLNLVGILTPGARVSPFSGQVIAYRNGVPIDVGELGAVVSRTQGQRPHPGR